VIKLNLRLDRSKALTLLLVLIEGNAIITDSKNKYINRLIVKLTKELKRGGEK
jgi:hypothetical protein